MPKTLLANDIAAPGLDAVTEGLLARRPLLDVVEEGLRRAEADAEVRWVGYGGAPNVLGQVECDASIMLGATMQAGAVGALQGYRHAVSVARQVLELSPHVLLVGEGAAHFANEIGAEPADLLSPGAERAYRKWLEAHHVACTDAGVPRSPYLPVVWTAARDLLAKDTAVLLAMDETGRLAGATSTSGWAYKYPGRLGDSPVIGAGLFVDDRYGAAVCTHTGEMTMRAGTARSVVAYLKAGAAVEEACYEALDDLRRLEGGFLGPVVIHALDRHGTPFVLSTTDGAAYYLWSQSLDQPELRKPVRVSLSCPRQGSVDG